MEHMNAMDGQLRGILSQRDWVERLARRLVHEATRADDLAQDALVAAMRGKPKDGVPLRSWLGGIVRNLARDGRRKRGRAEERERAVARGENEADHVDLIARADAHRALVEHVMALGEPHRALLLRRYFDGLNPSEIARADGRTVASVKSRLQRAHAALRARLEVNGGSKAWLSALTPLLPRGRDLIPGKTMVGAVAGGAALTAAVAVSVAMLSTTPTAVPSMSAHAQTARLEPVDRSRAAPTLQALGGAVPTRAAAIQTATLRAFVVDEGHQVVNTASIKLTDPEGKTWMAKAKELGAITLDGLPTGVTLTADILVGGALWSSGIESIRFASAEERRVTWSVHLTCHVSGVAVNAKGGTVAEQWIQLHKTTGTSRAFENDGVVNARIGSVQTDAHGHFAFPGVPPGRYRIGPARTLSRKDLFEPGPMVDGKPSLLRRRNPRRDVAPILEPLTIHPNEAECEVDIRLWTGLEVAGRAVASDGTPAEGLEIFARIDGVANALSTVSGAEGEFSFPGVVPGAYTLYGGYTGELWTVAASVTAESGQSDALVQALPTSEIHVTLKRPDGLAENASVSLIYYPNTMRQRLIIDHHHDVDRPNTFSFDGVPPGQYRVVYQGSQITHFGSAVATLDDDLKRPGAKVELEVTKASQIEVTNALPGAWADVRVGDDGGLFIETRLGPKETKRFAVPTSAVHVLASERDGKRQKSFNVTATPGAPQTIVYDPR